jgi:hypothetical protein
MTSDLVRTYVLLVVLSGQLLRCHAQIAGLAKRTIGILAAPDVQDEEVPAVRQLQRRLSAAEMVEIARAYQGGMDIPAIAARFGVHRTTISHSLHSLAIPIRRKGLRATEVAEAARLYADGWSTTRLGERYGCSHTSVRRVLLAAGVSMRPRPGWHY